MENSLSILAIVLLVLWLFAYVGYGVTSGFVHILLVLAVIIVMVRLFTDRRPVL